MEPSRTPSVTFRPDGDINCEFAMGRVTSFGGGSVMPRSSLIRALRHHGILSLQLEKFFSREGFHGDSCITE